MIYTIYKHISNSLALLFFLVINALIYFRWLSFNLFYSGDWVINTSYSFKDQFHVIPSYLQWRYLQYLFQYIFGIIGYGSIVSDVYIYYLPFIVLGPVAGYAIAKAFKLNVLAQVGISLLFLFNTYFITINFIGHLLISIAAYLFYISFSLIVISINNKQKLLSDTTYFGGILTLLFTGVYDFRILYIATITIVGLYTWVAIFHSVSIKYSLVRVIILLLFLLTYFSSFLLAVTLMTSADLTIFQVLQRGLYGFMDVSILKSLALMHPFWKLGEIKWFVNQSTTVYLFPLLFIIPTAFFLIKASRKREIIYIFLFLLLLISLFLSKQSYEPFRDVYSWIYLKIPGFNAFRESTKFYVPIVLVIGIMLGYVVHNVVSIQNRLVKCIVIFLCISIGGALLLNAYQIAAGTIGGQYISQKKIHEHEIIEFLSKDRGEFRTLWINTGVLYYSTKHQNIIPNKKELINACIDFEKYLQKNRIKYIVIQPDSTNGCAIKQLRDKLSFDYINTWKYYDSDKNKIVYSLYEYLKPKKFVQLIPDPQVHWVTSQNDSVNFYSYKIVLTPNNKTLLIEYPYPYSKGWMLNYKGKKIPSVKSKDGYNYWNIPVTKNVQSLHIEYQPYTIISWASLLMIIVPILLIILIAFIHIKNRKKND